MLKISVLSDHNPRKVSHKPAHPEGQTVGTWHVLTTICAKFLVFIPAGPLRQTFTHNPLQQTPPMAAASAKDKAAGGKDRPWKDTIG